MGGVGFNYGSPMHTALASNSHQPSKREQILVSQVLDLYGRSPESGDLWCEPRGSKQAIARKSQHAGSGRPSVRYKEI